MGHTNGVQMAVSRCPNPTVFQKTLAVNDFYFGSEEWNYPMGHISFVGKLDGVTLSAGAPAIAPGFTLDLMGKHSLDLWLTSEDLPDPENRVTINRDGEIVLNHGRQLLPVQRSGQSGTDDHRQCAARGRSLEAEAVTATEWLRRKNESHSSLSGKTEQRPSV